MRKNGEVKTHRSIFRNANGDGPFVCFFCLLPCSLETVHHKDGDHSNNDIENLVSCHTSCHQKFHHDCGGQVHYRKSRGHFVVRRTIDGRRVYVGSARTAKKAYELLEERTR